MTEEKKEETKQEAKAEEKAGEAETYIQKKFKGTPLGEKPGKAR